MVISEQAPDPSSDVPEEQAFEASLDPLFGEMNQLGQPAAMLQVRSACAPLSWLGSVCASKRCRAVRFLLRMQAVSSSECTAAVPVCMHASAEGRSATSARPREFFLDNLLVQIYSSR